MNDDSKSNSIARPWPPHWQLVETGDGSPSLKFVGSDTEEAMHHSGGAFAETRYIYEPLLQAGKDISRAPLIVSLGLGLGYNEIFTASVFTEDEAFHPRLHSFESDEWLREEFLSWVEGGDRGELAPIYDRICRLFGFEDAEYILRERIRQFRERGQFEIHEALREPEQIPKGAQLFLWDAFSRKTSPELWDESFLARCFARGAETMGLATYAHNGNLRRSLIKSGFRLETRHGFPGKRGATWAGRGKFPASPGSSLSASATF